MISIESSEINFNIDEKREENAELFLKEMHNQLLDMENRRISIKMSEILDI